MLTGEHACKVCACYFFTFVDLFLLFLFTLSTPIYASVSRRTYSFSSCIFSLSRCLVDWFSISFSLLFVFYCSPSYMGQLHVVNSFVQPSFLSLPSFCLFPPSLCAFILCVKHSASQQRDCVVFLSLGCGSLCRLFLNTSVCCITPNHCPRHWLISQCI